MCVRVCVCDGVEMETLEEDGNRLMMFLGCFPLRTRLLLCVSFSGPEIETL